MILIPKVKSKPCGGLEPPTLRLRVSRATDCASKAYLLESGIFVWVCHRHVARGGSSIRQGAPVGASRYSIFVNSLKYLLPGGGKKIHNYND